MLIIVRFCSRRLCTLPKIKNNNFVQLSTGNCFLPKIIIFVLLSTVSEKVFPPEQNTVLNSTEIYNFWAIFGKNYLPVYCTYNCTKKVYNFRIVHKRREQTHN